MEVSEKELNMINFNSKNEGTWFYFDEANHSLGSICLRVLSGDEYEKIQKITVKRHKKFKRGIAYDEEIVNEKLASKMRWDYCIVDWQNIAIDNQPVECTSENKQRLVKITNFISFVADCLEKLAESNKEVEEARLKNLETTSGGSIEATPAKPA